MWECGIPDLKLGINLVVRTFVLYTTGESIELRSQVCAHHEY